MGEVLIPSLMTGDCTDLICVRASRFWDFYDIHDETKLLHADLVLIDEEGNSIHAQLYKDAYTKFKSAIKEGGVYNLSCFCVKKSNNNYKPVTNDIMLNLSTWTQVVEVVEIPPAFPCITYSLTPIEQVPSRVNYTEYFTDVIGIVASVSDVMPLRAKGRDRESLKRVVTLRNASNDTVDVVLWGERASSFPAEQVQTNGQTSPQVVIFVGTLVKKKFSGEISLAGNAPCRWYINPEVPEARALLSSLGGMNQPIKWDKQIVPDAPPAVVEEKKVSELINLNPFKNKKNEFLVTVTIKKIDSSWWYNACKCSRTAKPYGNQYKCNEPTCNYTGKPTQRYKLTMVAGDETGDTNFIMFGKLVQRLAKKSADTLIAENPKDFIPNEITALLERIFKWNVSFTQQTTSSSKICFQVNAVIAEISDTNSLLSMTPATSQSSSLMISQGAGSSIQRTPQTSAAFPSPSKPTTSLATHASSATPTKTPLNIAEQQLTPQSRRHPNDNQDKALASTGDAPGDSSESQKTNTKKRSHPSPDKKVTKKLFTGEDGDDNDESGDGAAAIYHTSTSPANDA